VRLTHITFWKYIKFHEFLCVLHIHPWISTSLFDSAVIGLRNPTTSAANVNFQGPLWFEKAAPHNFPTTRKGDLHDLRVAPRSTGNAGGNTSLGFVTPVCWCNTNGNHFQIQHKSKSQQKLDLQVPTLKVKTGFKKKVTCSGGHYMRDNSLDPTYGSGFWVTPSSVHRFLHFAAPKVWTSQTWWN